MDKVSKTSRMRARASLLACAGIAALMGTCPAAAQVADDQVDTSAGGADGQPALGEIIVTAQRREENLQDTPVAITALTADQLDKSAISTAENLQYSVPNVTFAEFKGEAQYSIRGIGNDNLTIGGDPGVAFYQDNVYNTRNAVAKGGFFDVERIEILRGPQGTLYGRNAVGGVIHVISNKPTDTFEGHGDVLYGNYDRIRGRAAINMPLGDDLAVRVSGVLDSRDGYVTNLFDNSKEEDGNFRAVRGMLRYNPGDFDFLLSVVDENSRGTGLVRRLLTPQISPEILILNPGPTPTDPYQINFNLRDEERIDHSGISFTADLPVSNEITLRSISAYNKALIYQFRDLDNTTADFGRVARTDRDKTFTQELQLTGQSFNNRLDWVLGAFYMDNNVTNAVPYQVRIGLLNLAAQQDLEAKAAFAQGTLSVTDSLRVTAGIRYSHEKKRLFEQNVAPPQLGGNRQRTSTYSNGAWTPKVSVDFDVNPDTMIYASATKGFKSGGFNSSSFSAPYNPEEVWAYEVGGKTSLLDNKLRLNLAAFKYDYTDLQVLAKRPGDIVFSVQNASNASVKGVELEALATPVTGLLLSATVGYLDTRYRGLVTTDATRPALGPIDLSGNQLPRSPKWKGSVAAEYALQLGEGSLTPRVEFTFQDSVFFTPFNVPQASQDAFSKTNASLRYESAAGWDLTAYVRNLENTATLSNALVGSIASISAFEGYYDAPRTYGLVAGFKF